MPAMQQRNPKSIFINLSYTSGNAPSRIEEVVRQMFVERGYEVHTGRESVKGRQDAELLRLIRKCTVGVVILNERRDNVIYEWGLMDGLEMPVVVFKNTNYHYDLDKDFSDKKGVVWIDYPGDAEGSESIRKVIEGHPGLPDLWKWVEEEIAKRIVKPGTAITTDVHEAARILERAPIPTGSVETAPLSASEATPTEADRPVAEAVQRLQKVQDRFSPEGFFYLGNAAREAAQKSSDPQPSLQQAIAAYTEALRFRTAQAAPLDYAGTQNNLGVAYVDLAGQQQPVDNLRKAIAAFTEALGFYTAQAAPLNYAVTQNNLGVTYADLAGQQQPVDNLRKAIISYTLSLLLIDKAAPNIAGSTAHNLRHIGKRVGPTRFQIMLEQSAKETGASPAEVIAAMERHTR
jgi:tetratricopeptide (TPR) repeat protein